MGISILRKAVLIPLGSSHFRDPALESYIGEVVAGNIELGAALHAVEAAAGSARQAGALLRPQLNAAGMFKSS